MEKKYWTGFDIRRFFHFDKRSKSINTVYNAEAKGKIPTADRILRGKVRVRQWGIEDIPKIGAKFGFLPRYKTKRVICKYIQKGDVLKTTSTFNEARVLALNGIKTLIVGLDFECSITNIIHPRENINASTLEGGEKCLGLYHYFYEDASLNNIIKKTSLPTLDIIPETRELILLDKKIIGEKSREHFFQDKLIPYLEDYDVIIFDNGSNWNYLTENAISASDVIICPLGCNLLSFNTSKINLKCIADFIKSVNFQKHQEIITYPTLLDRSTLSQQIYAKYLSIFAESIISIPIRTSVKIQKSLLSGISIIEGLSTSVLAEDYYELITELWKRVNKNEEQAISKNLDDKKKKISAKEGLYDY